MTIEDRILVHEREIVDFDSKAVTFEYWTEWKRVVNGKVFNEGACCCPRPLASRRECADNRHLGTLKNPTGPFWKLKNPCRCDCHRKPPKKALMGVDKNAARPQ